MTECGVAPDHDDDVIRLTVPGRLEMGAVVTVAVRVVGRRLGLTEGQIEVARSDAADAFDELAGEGDVHVELSATAGHLRVVLEAAGAERTIELPRP